MARSLLVALAVATCTVLASVSAWAEIETVQGRIVDQTCYLKDPVNNKSNAHKMPADLKNCAIDCAKAGTPMALVTANGKLYGITGGLASNKNRKLVPHVGHEVEITGNTTEANGKTTIAAADLKMISN